MWSCWRCERYRKHCVWEDVYDLCVKLMVDVSNTLDGASLRVWEDVYDLGVNLMV